jgi:hypothetical protein
MSASEQSQMRTRMFARVLGPFFTIFAIYDAVRRSYLHTLFTEFKANPCGRGCSAPFFSSGAWSSSRFTTTGEALRRSSCRCWAGFWRYVECFF